MRFTFALILACSVSTAAQTGRAADAATLDRAQIRAAVRRAIPTLEKGAHGAAEKRKCFTCHNQALPLMALSAAKTRGFTIDSQNFERQRQHTEAHLKRGRNNYRKGKGQGGRIVTAGYALWALEAAGHAPDDTTAAVANYLLQYQKQQKHWSQSSKRPPTSGSSFMATYVALRGLASYGVKEQKAQIEARIADVAPWLRAQQPKDTEDAVFRLWSLTHIEDGEELQAAAVKQLLSQQRPDGGWAQTAKMKSDAYATGTVLAALFEAGGMTAEHPAVQRGIRYLLETQRDDGTWHVKTRAKGFQKYFESGFPHGKDQFISIAASSWATLALLKTLPAADGS